MINSKNLYHYKGEVIRVIDGDTFVVLVDLGFGSFIKRRIRLYGVNAYESRSRNLEEKEKGMAAKRFLTNLISNQIIFLRTYKTKTGTLKKTFDRYLADAYIKISGKLIDISSEIIENGHGVEKYY